MSKKSGIIVILAIVIVVGGIFYFSKGTGAQGTAVIGISDAATTIQGVSSIMVTVDKVEVQNATQAWTTVSSGSKQYDLLQLKQSGAVALLADTNLRAGTYNQVRLTISKVQVTAAGKVQDAKLPSGTLSIVGRLVVEEGKTATAVLDFKADESLHVTGNGQFILAPVVHLQTKSDASVETQADNTLKISGGKAEDDVTVGMDEHGDTKDNFKLDANAKIEIDADGKIQLVGQGKDESGNSDQQSEGAIQLNLMPQNNSGIAGTAMLENVGGKTKVTLNLNEGPGGVSKLIGISLDASHPAHIHLGSCAQLGAVKYPLNSTVNGKSVTTIDASLADLKAQLPLAINLHKSAAEIGTYIACADLHF